MAQPANSVVWDSLLKLAFAGTLLVMACIYGGSAFIIFGLIGVGLLVGLHYAGLRWGGRWMFICRMSGAFLCIAYGVGGAFLTSAAEKGAPLEGSVVPWIICLAAFVLGLCELIWTGLSIRIRMTKRKKRLIWTIILALLLVYVGSYVILSRRGFREADKGGYSGFYLLTLENSTAWELKNYGLVLLYYPLILIDVMLGTGRMPAMTEPMYEIDVSGY